MLVSARRAYPAAVNPAVVGAEAAVKSVVVVVGRSDSAATVSSGFGVPSSLLLLPYTRVYFMLLVLLSSLGTSFASVRCFNTEQGLTISGAEYHRVRGVDHRACAVECRDDPSCLAYEWNAVSQVCFLKARSLTGELQKNEETVIGFCLDEDDEIRDRFRDHEISGPIVVTSDDVEGDSCRAFCMQHPTASIYSWTPSDTEDDDADSGKCTCIESIRGISLSFNTFSGFLPVKRHKFRLK